MAEAGGVGSPGSQGIRGLLDKSGLVRFSSHVRERFPRSNLTRPNGPWGQTLGAASGEAADAPPRLGTPDRSGGERRRVRNGRGGAGPGLAWPLHCEAESRATAPAARHGGQRQARIHTPTRGGEAHTLGRKKTRDHSLSPYHGAGAGASAGWACALGEGRGAGQTRARLILAPPTRRGRSSETEKVGEEAGPRTRGPQRPLAAHPNSRRGKGRGPEAGAGGACPRLTRPITELPPSPRYSVNVTFFFFLKDILLLLLLRFLGAAEIWPKFGFKK